MTKGKDAPRRLRGSKKSPRHLRLALSLQAERDAQPVDGHQPKGRTAQHVDHLREQLRIRPLALAALAALAAAACCIV